MFSFLPLKISCADVGCLFSPERRRHSRIKKFELPFITGRSLCQALLSSPCAILSVDNSCIRRRTSNEGWIVIGPWLLTRNSLPFPQLRSIFSLVVAQACSCEAVPWCPCAFGGRGVAFRDFRGHGGLFRVGAFLVRPPPSFCSGVWADAAEGWFPHFRVCIISLLLLLFPYYYYYLLYYYFIILLMFWTQLLFAILGKD